MNTDSTRFGNPKFGNIRCPIFSFPKLCRRSCIRLRSRYYYRGHRSKEKCFSRTIFRIRNVSFVRRPATWKTLPSRKFSMYSGSFRVEPRKARNLETPVHSSCPHCNTAVTRCEHTGPR